MFQNEAKHSVSLCFLIIKVLRTGKNKLFEHVCCYILWQLNCFQNQNFAEVLEFGMSSNSSDILFFWCFGFSKSWNLLYCICFFFPRSWNLRWLSQELWNIFLIHFFLVFCRFFWLSSWRPVPGPQNFFFLVFAGFLKIVICSLCFLSCPWLSRKIRFFFPGEISVFPLPFNWTLNFSLISSIEFPTFLFSFLLNSLLFSSLFYWIPFLLFTCLLKSLLSVHFLLKSLLSLLVYWNPSFSYIFKLKPQLFSFLFYWNLCFLLTCWLESLLILYFSIERSAFFALFYWNLCFPYLSIEISTFPPLSYWNLNFSFVFSIESPTFLFSFLLNPLLILYLSIEISTYPLLFYEKISAFFAFLYWNLDFLYLSIEVSTFPLLFFWHLNFSLFFSIELPTVSLLVYWNLYFLFTFLLKPILSRYFSSKISTFSSTFPLNFFFSFEISTYSLLFLFEVSTFCLLFCGDLCFLGTFFWNL